MQSTGAETPEPVSALALFLESLEASGRAVISGPQPPDDGGDGALAALRRLDARSREELALAAPEFSPGAALWAARLLYQLCQFTVCRDLDEDRIAAACQAACPEPRGPETDWSADLLLRHLPALFQFARHLSNADPLVPQMKLIAAAWPLSSVGIPGLDALDLDPFIANPALQRLYADRIIAAADDSRLGDPRVDERLRAGLGIHHELSPGLAAKLFAAAASA